MAHQGDIGWSAIMLLLAVHLVLFHGDVMGETAGPRANRGAEGAAPLNLVLSNCSAATSHWAFGPHETLQWNGTLCLSMPHKGAGALLELAPCVAGGSATQAWVLDNSGDRHMLNAAAKVCASAKGSNDGITHVGVEVDVWQCLSKDNEQFELASAGQLLLPALTPKLCVAPHVGSSPAPPPVPPGPVIVDLTAIGRRWDGLGGLSAGASSRLLLDYKEPQRSQILDLLFKPKIGGTWQILKTEIGGDGQSSYGSETAVMHTESDVNYNRGYETWLLREAKARDSRKPTYCLSWTAPNWVGEYLSPAGVAYHVKYMEGVRSHINVSFDYAGIWNEDSWTADYIEQYRAAMDAAGFEKTQLVANDGSVGDLVAQMETDAKLRDAVQIVGVHAGVPSASGTTGARVAAMNKVYWESEDNIIDGPMYPDLKHDTALEWVNNILSNYILQNITGTIECPLFHAWTQNLGRHNHGSMMFNDPWSGHYQLGAPFWAQAQITQLVEIGWTMLPVGRGSGTLISGAVFVTFVSPNQTDFTIVLVTSATSPSVVTFKLLPGGSVNAHGRLLHVWTTTRGSAFKAGSPITPTPTGEVTVSVPAEAVLSVSTIADAAHVEFPVPPRTSFPFPYTASFDDQPVATPGRYLSDAWGSFEVFLMSSLGSTGGSTAGNHVLRQSAVGCPIVWHTHSGGQACGDSDPFTLLPSGTNWMNYKVAVRTMLPANATGVGSEPYSVICGRISIWPLRDEVLRTLQGSPPVGVCLILSINGTWRVEERDNHQNKLLGHGSLPAVNNVLSRTDSAGRWYNMSLGFSDDLVTYSIDSAVTSTVKITSMNGVAGFGSGFHHAFFVRGSSAPPLAADWLLTHWVCCGAWETGRFHTRTRRRPLAHTRFLSSGRDTDGYTAGASRRSGWHCPADRAYFQGCGRICADGSKWFFICASYTVSFLCLAAASTFHGVHLL